MNIVPRTCTELLQDGESAAQPLASFRDRPAYVLLGDPGAGKTTELAKESGALGDNGLLLTARDFITFDAEDHPEWRGKTLLIDGLDEIRAGAGDQRVPLDRIRAKLDSLGKPHFRLSCRHADWLTTDQRSLAAVSSSGKVAVLRLDPLDEDGTAQALEGRVPDAASFVKEAEERGLDGLLAIPQSLGLLVQAVHAGEWPGSRTETFEKACLAMAGERNDEHLSVLPRRDSGQTLDTAGRLCAALLLSGLPGCAAAHSWADENYPHMAESGSDDEACRTATASGLFRHVSEGRAVPVHRHIAEFIAARHIGGLIARGLPAQRVLALMVGHDGAIVSALRGLSAWLAALSTVARPGLIDRDPTGLALYGDIQAFSADEQRALFRALVGRPRDLEPTRATAPAFAALACPPMLDVLRDTITEPPDVEDGELVVDFVLRVLCEAPPLPGLSSALLETVQDGRRWPRVRDLALRVLIHYREYSELLALLGDVQEQRLADPNNQFLGKLLSALYPWQIPPRAIWGYFREDNEAFLGDYALFWVSELESKSSDAEIAELLDCCVANQERLVEESTPTLESCIDRLLLRGLTAHGDALSVERLYDWLDAGVSLHATGVPSPAEARAIRDWFEERPRLQAAVLVEAVRRADDEYWYAPYEGIERLFGATLADSVATECVIAAKAMASGNPTGAESLVRFAIGSGAMDVEDVRRLAAADPQLTAFLDTLETAPPRADARREQQEVRADERRRRRLDELKANADALRENRAPPRILNRLAGVYFDRLMGFKPDLGVARLQEYVGADEELLQAALEGLRQSVVRDDFPEPEAILQQFLRSRMHYLCRPYLAGLAEADRTGAFEWSWWTDQRIRNALLVYLAYPHGDYNPMWYERLVAERPATVAEVQVRLGVATFRAKVSGGGANFWRLAFDPAHAGVAAHASLPLLRAFPSAAAKDRLDTLDYLLLAASQHAAADEFVELIAAKLSLKALPPRQRGRWLAAGCAMAPAEFATAAMDFLANGRRQERTLHFARLFCPGQRTVSLVQHARVDLLTLLVRIIGRVLAPEEPSEDYVTRAMEAGELVAECIRMLGATPDAGATAALEALMADSQLARWRFHLVRAADDQRVIRREDEYRHPTFEEVVEALDNGAPAGPADLAALVVDRLDDIQAQIRHANTDGWKAFWNEDSYGEPTCPKREESGTNALLDKLRPALPAGVRAEPEAHYARDARADIGVSYRDWRIPIEVKRNSHRELWRAAREQLMAKYAIDPGAAGYGIYLVLWFGREHTQLPPKGRRPADPEGLRRQLEDTLTDQERRFIAVRVVDVSPP